ncbi:AraC family transcriptional regulator [Pinisolibacter sp.]|uniref:AraC family transcriptional regulator n=1 Tax=Pinisolibacter sp. TaxID=2172024 RepID=UPI002FDDB01A
MAASATMTTAPSTHDHEVPPLAPGETARYFVSPRFPDLDCLTATFTTHTYSPHTHDTYVMGSVGAGVEVWNARGRKHYAGAGDLLFNLPLDVHDGMPWEGGYSYRMTYPSEAFLTALATEVSGRRATTPFFRDSVVHDPRGSALFETAHRLLESGHDGLAAEEMLIEAYAHVLDHHAGVGLVRTGREGGPVARVMREIEERYRQDLRLADLARLAGLSTHHLIRAFRREVGLTPHAHLIGVRVRRARDLLRAGEMPAAVASAVGFADQAHLTRVFKARIGVPPGAYRRAVIETGRFRSRPAGSPAASSPA